MKTLCATLLATLLVTSCASQPPPSPEMLVKDVQSRAERISILAKECDGEVYNSHLQSGSPHRMSVRDRTHIVATRNACEALANAIRNKNSISQIDLSYSRCLAEAENVRVRSGLPVKGHVARQKSLCDALYKEK